MEALLKLSSLPLISMFGAVITVGGAISAAFILSFGLWLSRRMKTEILGRSDAFDIDRRTAATVSTLVFYSGTGLTLLLTASILGVRLQNFMVLAGALSVGIGFGLQGIANNFVSGLILLFDRSLRVGDYVELSDGLRGTISQVRVRSTIIQTNDLLEVIVPNSKFLSDQVINYTLSNDNRRLHVPFSVAYGSDVQKVRQVALQAAASLPFVVHDDSQFEPVVWMTSMADSSLNFELLVWIHGQSTSRPSGTLSECLLLLHQTLVDNGIQIPFPQRDVHIKDAPESAGRGQAAARRPRSKKE